MSNTMAEELIKLLKERGSVKYSELGVFLQLVACDLQREGTLIIYEDGLTLMVKIK